MNVGDVGVGGGLAVWGAAFYAFSTWMVRDDARMRKLAESRWPIDRRQRKIRRGEMSQEDWFDRYIGSQRALVKWLFTPFIVLWFALCISMIVHGLTSR